MTSHTPNITKHVLQLESRTREEAAWELLRAIEKLFPDQIEKLRSITENEDLGAIRERFGRWGLGGDSFLPERIKIHVQKWTKECHITCEAVDQAAKRFAVGYEGPEEFEYALGSDEEGNLVEPPTITAKPHTETKEEFLERADVYFDEVCDAFQPGRKRKPLKLDTSHFQDLAAFLVGRCTWADIANGKTKLKLPLRNEKTVSAGARKAAGLIGLAWSTKRGPRPGTRRR